MLNFTPKKIKFKDKITHIDPTTAIAHGREISDVDTAHQVVQGRLHQHSISSGGTHGSGEHIRKMSQSLAKAEVRHGGEDEKFASATATHSYNSDLVSNRSDKLRAKLQSAQHHVVSKAFSPKQNPQHAEPNPIPQVIPSAASQQTSQIPKKNKFSQFFNRH